MRKNVNYINIKGSINKSICLISDIHFYRNYNPKVFEILYNDIKDNKPDYICIPGDLIDNPNLKDNELKELFSFLEKISNISKIVVSLGNHDLTLDKKYFVNKGYLEGLKKIPNLHLLINDEYIDGNIRFVGEEDNVEISHEEKGAEKIVIDEYNTLFSKFNMNNKYNVLLAHNPIYLVNDNVTNNIRKWDNLDLVLSGHTHGGLLPSFMKTHMGIISPGKRFFPKNIRGHYYKKGIYHIISNGVIKLSNAAKLLHLFNFIYPISIDYIYIKKEK